MNVSSVRRFRTAAFAVLISTASAATALAQSPVKVQAASGAVALSPGGTSPFVLEGTASHLGRFTARGEIELVSGQQPDSFVGEGIVVITAANGDLLAGVATFDLGEGGLGHVHFSWRDAVQFSDGTVVETTGRFVNQRPPGALIAMEWARVLLVLILSI